MSTSLNLAISWSRLSSCCALVSLPDDAHTPVGCSPDAACTLDQLLLMLSSGVLGGITRGAIGSAVFLRLFSTHCSFSLLLWSSVWHIIPPSSRHPDLLCYRQEWGSSRSSSSSSQSSRERRSRGHVSPARRRPCWCLVCRVVTSDGWKQEDASMEGVRYDVHVKSGVQ